MSRRTRTSYLIRRAQLVVYANLSECLSQHKLTPMQYMLLNLSRRGGEMSSADLARRFAVTPQSMNEMIAALQRKRLIVRNVSSAHRRIRRISLTSKGARLLKTCDREVDAMEKRLFGCLAPPALDALRDALTILIGRSGSPAARTENLIRR
jgi:DNA-binding MarR family transcriptional regulator